VTLFLFELRHFDHATTSRTDDKFGRASITACGELERSTAARKSVAFVGSLMGDFTIAVDGAFKRPQAPASPRRHSIKVPALTPTKKFLHDLGASESGYCSRNNPGYFGKWVY
jgi:hypothetical protein